MERVAHRNLLHKRIWKFRMEKWSHGGKLRFQRGPTIENSGLRSKIGILGVVLRSKWYSNRCWRFLPLFRLNFHNIYKIRFLKLNLAKSMKRIEENWLKSILEEKILHFYPLWGPIGRLRSQYPTRDSSINGQNHGPYMDLLPET